jgi:transposase-like protein
VVGIVTGTAAGIGGTAWARPMPRNSHAHHQFPPMVIQRAVWLYDRFTPSFRGVENLLAERSPEVS